MSQSSDSRRFPDIDRISIVSAVILLAYALSRFIDIPSRELSLQLPGIFLNIQINTRTVVALFVAALTGSGAYWLIQDHPALGKRSTIPHLLLPSLTALVLGFAITQMPIGPLWWIGFLVVGAVLIVVLIAEYNVVDPFDPLHPLATITLTALSYALFLALAVSLRNSGFRLFVTLPIITFAAWLISLRTMNLRMQGKWALLQSGIVALLTAQLVAGFHYWMVSPVVYGLLLLAPSYALMSLLASMDEGTPFRSAVIEPMIVLVVVIAVAVFLG